MADIVSTNNLDSNDKEIKLLYVIINIIAGVFFGFLVFLALGLVTINYIYSVRSEFGIIPVFDLKNPILGLAVIFVSVTAGLIPLGKYLSRKYTISRIVLLMLVASALITVSLVVLGHRQEDAKIVEITPKPVKESYVFPPLPKQSDVESLTYNWRVYTEPKFKFQVKYPTYYGQDETYGYDGVGLVPQNKPTSFSCTIHVRPPNYTVLSVDSEAVKWNEKVVINGLDAERFHSFRNNISLYAFEDIIIKQDDYTFQLTADAREQYNRKECELIFSTFKRI